MTGKIAWLANSTRPDLSFIALKMSQKVSVRGTEHRYKRCRQDMY